MSGGFTKPDSIIFAWDLDQTLAHRVKDTLYMNLKPLRYMNKLFNSYKYGANLLLTNNSNKVYIDFVHESLTKKYNEMFPKHQKTKLFDNIYSATQEANGTYTTPRVLDESVPNGIRTPNHLAKRLEDVANMIEPLGISTEPSGSLSSRVFFFDDIPNHNILYEINKGNYINITPPFTGQGEDNTDYSTVDEALGGFEIVIHRGGASKKYRKTKGKGNGKKRRGKKLTKRRSG